MFPSWLCDACRCGRGLFQKCLSVVKRVNDVHEDDWKVIKYLVFDAPKHGSLLVPRCVFCFVLMTSFFF
jgi:hypothetical protein